MRRLGTLNSRVVLVTVVGSVSALSLLAQSGETARGTGAMPKAPMAMPMAAPLFIENGDYTSSIAMVNELTLPVHAAVIAYAPDGSELARKIVAFAPHSQEVLSLSALLSNRAPHAAIGSVQVVPDPIEVKTMAIAAQLSITSKNTTPATYLEEEFISLDPELSSEYRAVAPSAIAPPTVALLSTISSSQRVVVTCLEENATPIRQAVDLASKQLLVLRACGGNEEVVLRDLSSSIEPVQENNRHKPTAMALDISTNAAAGSLAVWGISANGTRESDANAHPARPGVLVSAEALNFTNTASMRSSSTVFAGVPVGVADLLPGDDFRPDVAVANFGKQAATVSIVYSSMLGQSPQVRTIAAISVPAGAVQHVWLPELNGDPSLRNSFIIKSDAAPGTMVGNVVSRGHTTYPTVQLVGKDAQDINNGGGHPWTLSNGDESTVLLFNHATKPTIFNANIATGTARWHQEYILVPNETRTVSIGEIVRNQVPDLTDRKLPAVAVSGEVSWFTADRGNGAGRLLVSNPQMALARNFSCGYNIVMCGSYLDTGTATFAVGATGTLGPIEPLFCTAYSPTACSGQSYGSGGSGSYYSWYSNNTSIATISGSSTYPTGTFLGKSPGTASGQGNIANGTGCSFVTYGTNYVLVPKSLKLQTGAYTTYNGQAYGSIPHYYGYSQAETYTVLDQNGHVLTLSGMTAAESITVVSSNPSGVVDTAPAPVSVNAQGQFLDHQSFGFPSPPPPQPGEYLKSKQTISIQLAGHSYQVRVNCIDAEYSAVTITDETANPGASCK